MSGPAPRAILISVTTVASLAPVEALIEALRSRWTVVQLDGATYRLSTSPGTTDEDNLGAVRAYLDARDDGWTAVVRVDLES